jgi:hypothetical protein
MYAPYHGNEKNRVMVLNHLDKVSYQMYHPLYDIPNSKKERIEEHQVPYSHPNYYKYQIQKFLTSNIYGKEKIRNTKRVLCPTDVLFLVSSKNQSGEEKI